MKKIPDILDLNYTPVVFVNTEGMPEDEWLDYRRKGICGSDAPIVMEQSPWNTPLGLYNDKLGIEPLHPEEKDGVALEVGHLLEPVVAKLFAEETGYKVYKDYNMYQHPLFPFMLVNLDYIAILPDGSRAVVECKTGSVYTAENWENNQIPEHYIAQLRHEMCVFNVDKVFIPYLLGNSKSGFGYRVMERDLVKERELIQAEAECWKHVETKTPPQLIHPDPELALKIFTEYVESKSGGEVTLDPSYGKILAQISEINEQISALEKRKKELDKQRQELYLPIAQEMGDAETAKCGDILLTYKTSTRNGADYAKLKSKYPEAYAECYKPSVSRSFRLKMPKENTVAVPKAA